MSMVPAGESNSKGKAVASSEPKPEFKCPRCCKIFHSAPALCGHQNAHRLVKEPMNISPVLAAVLNNPLPPDDKPELITPSPKPAGINPTVGTKELISKQPSAGNVSPRYHPYKRFGKEPIQDNLVKETCYNNNPDKEAEGGEDFMKQLIQKDAQPQYHPFERVLPEYSQDEYPLPQCLMTMDLLGEWMPISGFGDHGHLHGTSTGRTLSDPFLRIHPMEAGEAAGLEIGSKTSPGHLDLELKLGF
ncbi:hypothetical protein QQP08_016476 [Theobroma cacao]|nr:hypothetical protein QQP08_016476 [Theobroma cacao]